MSSLLTQLVAEPKFGPATKVAVIGAGISGVTAAAHLLKEGVSVTVFERSGTSGGVWHYEKRVSESPSFPNEVPSIGDYKVSRPGQHAYPTPPPEPLDEDEPTSTSEQRDKLGDPALEIRFSPPGPCYAGLKNNISTRLMVSVLDPWPEGTEENTTQDKIEGYIQLLAKNHGVNDVTLFHTRVDEVRKSDDGEKWAIRAVTLDKSKESAKLAERHYEFDAVVVASGHYNMPRVPDMEGLKEWKAAFPRRLIHSKQYRVPEKYRDQNLLVIGAGVSAVDICKELNGVAKKSYQSARGGPYDLPASILPPNAARVGEIERFVLEPGLASELSLEDEKPIPGQVVLKDGSILEDIHHVIVATGYITSYPFLPQLHSDTREPTDAGEELLVTSEGDMAHNLHKDIFYINDPTLSFVGVPYHVATFSLFDHQAQVVARVLSGKALLPSHEEMREEYNGRLRDKGAGRGFHSLREEDGELKYVKDLVDWVNRDADARGLQRLPGHTDQWIDQYWVMRERLKEFFKKPAEEVA
ncbi:FAD/NAD(P)-binding domain-containing protein [Thozetella sp. PMI_491]|nr:FAD/NAD(P)-binding domain-containing protein [Thozetella sp. PMI_491]